MKTSQLDEYVSLVEAVCDDTLTDKQQARIEQLARESSEFRDFYVRSMKAEALLTRYGAKLLQTEESDKGTSVVDNASAVIIEVKPASLSRRHKRYDSIHWQRHRIRFNAMTAVLTALAWAGFSYFVWSSTTPDDSRPNRDGVNVNFVARITGQHEHRWVDGMHGMPPNAFLVPGERLQLEKGIIEITFYDGAVVVLEGPTEFVVDSSGAGTLEAGKLTAVVMPKAVGFAVQTPTCRVVDLGTAFALSVDDDQQTEVYVKHGLVEVLPDATAFRSEPIQLRKGERLGLSRESGKIVRDEIAPVDFVFVLPTWDRPFTPQTPRSGPVGLIAYWDFNSEVGGMVTDVSGNGLTGIMSDGAALSADGGGHTGLVGDKAIDLTGSNSAQDRMTVTKEQFDAYNPNRNSFSVSFWVKPTVIGAFTDHADTNGYVISANGANVILGEATAIGIVLGSGGGNGTGWDVPGTTTIGVQANSTWQHVALVVDRPNAKFTIYIDGVAETTYTSAFSDIWQDGTIPGTVGDIKFNLSDLDIGDQNGSTTLEGYIDDYAIFDNALTADEIIGLFHRRLTLLEIGERLQQVEGGVDELNENQELEEG